MTDDAPEENTEQKNVFENVFDEMQHMEEKAYEDVKKDAEEINKFDDNNVTRKKTPGMFTPEIYKKGFNDFFGKEKLNDGDVFYTVWDYQGGGFDTLNQETAIIMSSQIRIEKMLRRLEQRIKIIINNQEIKEKD